MMKVVKLTTPWNHGFLKHQINPDIRNFRFEIDNECSVCDYWIVWGDIPAPSEQAVAKCPVGNIIFMTDEAYVEKQFNQQFLNQFASVITCRSDVGHKDVVRTHEINTWHLNKTFNEVCNTKPILKNKELSVVCSDLTLLPGHKRRFAFVNKLIGHFKDKLDVYGRGFNAIEDKWKALAPYKYSIAIENSSLTGYFTEKITECYLAHTFPVYYGAPDIDKYFEPESFLRIDINDYKSSIVSIEKLLEENPWPGIEDVLVKQKMQYLNKYHLYSALANILDKREKGSKLEKKSITINGHKTFEENYRLKKVIYKAKKWFAI